MSTFQDSEKSVFRDRKSPLTSFLVSLTFIFLSPPYNDNTDTEDTALLGSNRTVAGAESELKRPAFGLCLLDFQAMVGKRKTHSWI